MTSNEFIPISSQTVNQIPQPSKESFHNSDLPYGQVIIDEVFYEPKDPIVENDKPGEVMNAKKSATYIGMNDQELAQAVPELIASGLNEMADYETISRKPMIERLQELKKIASTITRILDLSTAGDYYHLRKDDQYKDDSTMLGADRVRSDESAKVAIALAGIKAGWSDEELLLFLNEPVLMNDNEKLNALQDRARQALINSGIRLVYSGREDEIKEIKLVLSQRRVFIPEECVDFVGPDGIKNTVDQTREMKKYLEENLKEGEAFIQPINIQGIRAMRMANEHKMIPSNTKAYIWAMPTVTGSRSETYRKKEIKGAVYYALTKQASFEPADHKII